MAHACSTRKAIATAVPTAYFRIMTLLHNQQRRPPQQPQTTPQLLPRAQPQNKRLKGRHRKATMLEVTARGVMRIMRKR
jgi:hypothetical protein